MPNGPRRTHNEWDDTPHDRHSWTSERYKKGKGERIDTMTLEEFRRVRNGMDDTPAAMPRSMKAGSQW
mgnify:CR=1 FL=1